MKYIVTFCILLGMAGCLSPLLIPDGSPLEKQAGMLVLGGWAWFMFGIFLGLTYKFVKWMFRS